MEDEDYHVRIDYTDSWLFIPPCISVYAQSNDDRLKFKNLSRQNNFFVWDVSEFLIKNENKLIDAVFYYINYARLPECNFANYDSSSSADWRYDENPIDRDYWRKVQDAHDL